LTGDRCLLIGVSVFEELGLKPDEEAVYVAVVDRPGCRIEELTDVGLTPAKMASALADLESRGLVSLLPGRPRRYTAADPGVALEALIRSREEGLQRARLSASLLGERHREARAATVSPQDVVEIVRSREATIQRWREVQRSAQHEVITFDRPPYLLLGINELERELLATGVAYRSVYDRSAFDVRDRIAEIRTMTEYGEQSRMASNVPVKMFIADARVGLISLHGTTTADSALVVHQSSLLDSMVALFEEIWRRAVPLGVAIGAGPAQPSERDVELLSALAAGLTDEAIAHQRDVNPRTVRRHVRRLLDELGVETRFQAGLQAGRRGWL
jgi:sugar-specific transcriptional regulator TrmB/DNA-binding CsgD family transcriptional regulator